jgi:CheY-like chemotaxis protein
MAKIMLVEDDNNLREIYEARLLAEGYEIVSAKDGEEALALAVKEKPDLIISDVMMPKISGFDMLDILRSTPETKNTKVIMMTALSQAEDKARADKLGADRYLVKSQVTLEDVAKVAHEVLTGEDESASSPLTTPEPEAAVVTEPAPAPAPAPVAVVPAPAPVPEPVATAPAVVPEPAPAPDPTPATPVATPLEPTPAPAPAPAVVPEPAVAPDPTPAPLSTAAPASAATPEPLPASVPEPVAVAPAAPVDQGAAGEEPLDSSQTTASEEAAIDAQINDFISKVAPETAAPAAPAPEPEPATAPITEEPAAPAVPVQQIQVATPPAGDTSASGRKIIAPLPAEDTASPTSAPKPDLNALLAKEEAKEQAAAAAQDAPATPTLPIPPSGEDPNSIAL